MSIFDKDIATKTFPEIPEIVCHLITLNSAEYWNCHPEECSTEVFKYLNNGMEPKDFAVKNWIMEVLRIIDTVNFFKSQVEPYFNFNKILSRNVAYTEFYSDDDIFPINITDLNKDKKFPDLEWKTFSSRRHYMDFVWNFPE